MPAWAASRQSLRLTAQHSYVLIRTGGGDTVEGCTRLQLRHELPIRHPQAPFNAITQFQEHRPSAIAFSVVQLLDITRSAICIAVSVFEFLDFTPEPRKSIQKV